MQRSTSRAIAATAAGAIAFASSLLPGAAHAASATKSAPGTLTDDTTAYVWADQPTASSYTPSSPYSYNNLGGANSIQRFNVGQYLVTFGGMGPDAASSGTVDVTPYGSTPATCAVTGWGPSGNDAVVGVDCYSLSGAPLDTYYTVDFTSLVQPLFATSIGYVWANQPTTFQYQPASSYNYTDRGGPIWATRFGTGQYLLTVKESSFGGASGGTVKVTPYGAGAGSCEVVNWSPSANQVGVEVDCFDVNGAFQDRMFTATWTDGSLDGTAYADGFAWANNPSSAAYTPSKFFQRIQFTKSFVKIARLGTGTYQVKIPRVPNFGGNAQVTAYGSDGNHCQVQYWGALGSTGEIVGVLCFNKAGSLTDQRFSVQWGED